MGLAAPKKKIKLSHDPNNTKWISDTSSFGHRMLTSQGWQAGDYLGVKDAAHAEFHTAANASHIRVAIKDDNLGLGAKLGTGVGHGECTGLDAFKTLLGRLNGKDEDEIVKEQRQRDDIRRAIYTEKRWGSVRFVSGGFLIGDKIQVLIDAEAARIRKMGKGQIPVPSFDEPSATVTGVSSEAIVTEERKKSKKRKAEVIESTEPEVVAVKIKKSKKKQKKESQAEESVMEVVDTAVASKKKSKKDRKSKLDSVSSEDDTKINDRRKEKKDKEERKRRKREKAGSASSNTEAVLKVEERREAAQESVGNSEIITIEKVSTISIPTAPYARPATIMQGRHAVRSRNIAQKRLASMDVASLNQIFMIKSKS